MQTYIKHAYDVYSTKPYIFNGDIENVLPNELLDLFEVTSS